ncbi:hypothetical protein ACFLWA_12480 [Chloroflexota bacterium]
MTQSAHATSEQLIDGLAQQISQRRLQVPAIALLEIARPFSFVASQGLLLAQPFLGFLLGEPRIGQYAELLADRANLDRMITRLERDQLAAQDSDVVAG